MTDVLSPLLICTACLMLVSAGARNSADHQLPQQPHQQNQQNQQNPQQQQQQQQPPVAVKVRDCEPLTITACSSIGYNVTGMPNLVGHETQRDAAEQLATFTPLVQYGCSQRLTLLLCSTYAPMCTEKLRDPIGPCRPLCEGVRELCEPVLNQFGFPWPIGLNCSKFPPKNDQRHMCMPGPPDVEVTRATLPAMTRGPPTTGEDPGLQCGKFRGPQNYVFVNETFGCVLRCDRDGAFTVGERRFAEVWMSVWAALAFLSTTFTVVTFAIDSTRFSYPERATVVIALCYGICSVAYLVRLVAGREAIACHVVVSITTKVLVQAGLENTDCTVVFLLLYYFTMAAAVWWVLLTALWCLMATRGWTEEAIGRHSTVYHVIAWSLPTAMTVAILVQRSVDADELTGMCFVGNQSERQLLTLVIAPICAYLLLGGGFLLVGFVGFHRKRDDFNSPRPESDPRQGAVRGGAREDRRTRMKRLGAYSLLYALALLCLLSCCWYEYARRGSWYSSASDSRPAAAVLALRTAATLLIGAASGAWLCRRDTLRAWTRFYHSLCRCVVRDSRRSKTTAGLLHESFNVAARHDVAICAVMSRTAGVAGVKAERCVCAMAQRPRQPHERAQRHERRGGQKRGGVVGCGRTPGVGGDCGADQRDQLCDVRVNR